MCSSDLAAFAGLLADAAGDLGIPLRVRERARWAEVTARRRDAVLDLLVAIGAEGSALDVAEDEIVRSAREDANRRANFDTANLSRQVRAAREQLAAIAALEASGALEGLPPALRETAALRAANPEMALSELAEAAGVARPTLAARLRRIVEAAEPEPARRSRA